MFAEAYDNCCDFFLDIIILDTFYDNWQNRNKFSSRTIQIILLRKLYGSERNVYIKISQFIK